MVQTFRKITRVGVVLASFGVVAVFAASSSKNPQQISVHESLVLRSGHQYDGNPQLGGIFPRDSNILERLAKRQQQSNSTSGSGSGSGTSPPTNAATDSSDSSDPTGTAADTSDNSSSDSQPTDSSTAEPSSSSLEPTASSTEPVPTSSSSANDEPIPSSTETPAPEPTSSTPRETLTVTGDEDDPGTTTKTLIVKPTGRENSSTDDSDASKTSSANRSLQTNGSANLKAAGYGAVIVPAVAAAAFAL